MGGCVDVWVTGGGGCECSGGCLWLFVVVVNVIAVDVGLGMVAEVVGVIVVAAVGVA